MGSIWTTQPGKGLYTVYYFASLPARIFAVSLYYILPFLRPSSAWPFRQALGNFLFYDTWRFGASIEYHPDKSLATGKDGDRFLIIDPGSPDLYRGILNENQLVKPARIGGMWYNRAFSPPTDLKDKKTTVILHFHGGAFVMGGCRPIQGGYAPELLAKTFSGLTFAPQYRLSWQEHGHFPAPIQDAVTAYNYLFSLGIPATNIILSGDSAGGNLALALLRYLEEFPSIFPANKHKPKAVLLWSPWVNLREGAAEMAVSPHRRTDWIPTELAEWALRAYLPDGRVGAGRGNRYVSPFGNEFETSVPVFVQTCDQELLFESNVGFAENMRAIRGNRVGEYVIREASHDAFAAAPILGTQRQAEGAAAEAWRFVMG